MQIQIISIGDELLMGDTVNTNASWMGQFFADHGAEVSRVYTVGDDTAHIRETVTAAMDDANLVITTGGLGPTHDDITKTTIADMFEAEMEIHEPTLEFVKSIFEKRNIPFSKSNYDQVRVPENCDVLFNKKGTAPGMWFEEEGTFLAVLPGIPREMKALIRYQVLPRIQERTNGIDRSFARHIKVAGIGESTLSDEYLAEVGPYLTNNISVAYLPSPQANTIRVNSRAATRKKANRKSEALVEYIYNQLGPYIIGEGKDLTLSEATGNALRDHSLTVAVAESCTGGLLANTLTDTPGSSDYMVGGAIAYANRVKVEQLNVDSKIIREQGAVSKPVALQMAKNGAQNLDADIGISTTGIARPGGGTDEKPVGTVWIGFWSTNAHFALKTLFTNDRLLNKERSVAVALEMVRRTVLDIETMPYGIKPHHA
jgi:nicotinamide-nucleotide amidase